MDHGEHNEDQFRSRHTDFFSQIKYKTEVDNILVKVTSLRINLSFGIPFPHST